ncbi:cell envelope-related function transcriptional attenuator common domain-containing protein [Nakamurella panacisegetis]|uniref:Cell envelope-related function transcriptional attenuator common domain-containing protein n=1 Tax=Nakamurella panacisegetis TaxID=1090615 RepID=A0A1H0PGL6_9ACTN|nr:LCP family protein [Nakamurella panacisegetis]SDP04134.1 cell envelope-related function transcriptional attenuator common domain-containing protein [Nakamurella panacisegetis]
MNWPSDPDPQRGPRRYGPSRPGDPSGEDPHRPGPRASGAAGPPWPPAGPNGPGPFGPGPFGPGAVGPGAAGPRNAGPGAVPPANIPPGSIPAGQPVRRPIPPGRVPTGLPGSGRPSAQRPTPDARGAWSDVPSDRTAVYPGGIPFDPVADPRSQRPVPPRGRDAGPNALVDPSRESHRRTHGGIIAGRIVAAALSVAVLALCAFGSTLLGSIDSKIPKGNSASKAGTAGVLFKGGTNILLIGSDSRTDSSGNPLSAAQLAEVSTQDDGGSVNTDTIMIVHIPEGGGKATAVSIPRDTWIPASVTNQVKGPYNDGTSGTYKPNKVNSFYSTAKFYTQEYDVKKGGMTAAQREVDSNNAGRTELQAIIQAFTGLRIDHYAEVNLIGFYTLSLAIGGVPVCLNKAVSDPFSGANFKAGVQEISGSAAMSFVRQRHGLPNGDLDRVRRQQAFLAGATSKMLSAGTLTSTSKLNSLVDAASKAVILDSGFELVTFAEQMANLSGGNVTFTTIPTHGAATTSGTDALATDPAEIQAFFRKIDGSAGSAAATSASKNPTTSAAAAVDPSTITVDVQNATKVNNLASSVSATLVSAGFKAGDITTFPGITAATAHATTTISYPGANQAAAAAVRKALGGKGKLVKDDSIASGHISVAAGQDMPAPSGLRAAGAVGIDQGQVGAPASAPSTAPINASGVECVN